MFVIGLFIFLLTIIYIQDSLISQVALMKATVEHVKMSPYHYYDYLDRFLR